MTEAVHVVDDDEALRDSLAFLLQTVDLEARTYESADAFLAALPSITGGCVLTDVRMPGLSGIDLVRRLKAMGSQLPVIIMTGHADVPLAIEAMKAGVVDFIEKPFDDDVLLAAIREALHQGAETTRTSHERAVVRERIAALSPREKDVLDGLVAGKANKVIAFDLGISPRTVEIYRANLMTKMQAASLSELVRMVLIAAP
jgi:two-component system response regulator FixJ